MHFYRKIKKHTSFGRNYSIEIIWLSHFTIRALHLSIIENDIKIDFVDLFTVKGDKLE